MLLKKMIIDDCVYTVDHNFTIVSGLDIEDVNQIGFGLGKFCTSTVNDLLEVESLIIRESNVGDAYKTILQLQINELSNRITQLRQNREMPVEAIVVDEAWESRLRAVHQKLVVAQKSFEANPTSRKRSKFEKAKSEQLKILLEKNYSGYLEYLTENESFSDKGVYKIDHEIMELEKEIEVCLAKASNIRYLEKVQIRNLLSCSISKHPFVVKQMRIPIIFNNTFSFLTYENKVELLKHMKELSQVCQVVYLCADSEIEEISSAYNLSVINKSVPSMIDLTGKMFSSTVNK